MESKIIKINKKEFFKAKIKKEYNNFKISNINDFKNKNLFGNLLDFKLKSLVLIKNSNLIFFINEYIPIILMILFLLFNIFNKNKIDDIYYIKKTNFNLNKIKDCTKYLKIKNLQHNFLNNCDNKIINSYKIQFNLNNILFNNNHYFFITIFWYFLVNNLFSIYNKKFKNFNEFFKNNFLQMILIFKNLIGIIFLILYINSFHLIILYNIFFALFIIYFWSKIFLKIFCDVNMSNNLDETFTFFISLILIYFLVKSKLLRINIYRSKFYILIIYLLIIIIIYLLIIVYYMFLVKEKIFKFLIIQIILNFFIYIFVIIIILINIFNPKELFNITNLFYFLLFISIIYIFMNLFLIIYFKLKIKKYCDKNKDKEKNTKLIGIYYIKGDDDTFVEIEKNKIENEIKKDEELLPLKDYENFEINQETLCLNCSKNNQNIIIIPCKHGICDECFLIYWSKNKNCNTCDTYINLYLEIEKKDTHYEVNYFYIKSSLKNLIKVII